jgi:hypothetical protein
MSEQADPMLPAQRVYAMSVVAAEQKYRAAVAAAREIRDREIAEALDTCERVMRIEAAP